MSTPAGRYLKIVPGDGNVNLGRVKVSGASLKPAAADATLTFYNADPSGAGVDIEGLLAKSGTSSVHTRYDPPLSAKNAAGDPIETWIAVSGTNAVGYVRFD